CRQRLAVWREGNGIQSASRFQPGELLAGVWCPEDDRSIIAPRSQTLAVWREGNCGGETPHAVEPASLLAAGHFPQLDLRAQSDRGQTFSVRGERHNRAGTPSPQHHPGTHVPQPDGASPKGRGQDLAVRRESQSKNLRASLELANLLACCRLP